MSNESLRKKIAYFKNKSNEETERKQLNRELFELKHRRVIGVARTIGSGIRTTGRGLGTMLVGLNAQGKEKKKGKGNQYLQNFAYNMSKGSR